MQGARDQLLAAVPDSPRISTVPEDTAPTGRAMVR